LNISENDSANEFLLKSTIYKILNHYFLQLNKQAQGEDSINKQYDCQNELIERIIQLVQKYDVRTNLDDIFSDALSQGLSKNMLLSAFKNRLGKNIYEYQKEIGFPWKM
jgi:hypothetical protein